MKNTVEQRVRVLSIEDWVVEYVFEWDIMAWTPFTRTLPILEFNQNNYVLNQ